MQSLHFIVRSVGQGHTLYFHWPSRGYRLTWSRSISSNVANYGPKVASYDPPVASCGLAAVSNGSRVASYGTA